MKINKFLILLTVIFVSVFFIACNEKGKEPLVVEKNDIDEIEYNYVVEAPTNKRIEVKPINTERPERKELILLKKIEFVPLEANEGLELEIKRSEGITKLNNPDTFIVMTTSGRDIFKFNEGSYFHHEEYTRYLENENNLSKALFFLYRNVSDTSYGLNHGLCSVNGESGKIELYLTKSADFFQVDNKMNYLCVGNAGRVPIIKIYNLESTELIKEVVYEPYRGKGMYPVEMEYEDGSFIVTLGADTAEYTTLEIPIDRENTYEVIDGYSFEENM